MFFKGKRQSEEFARGAWATRDLVSKIEAAAKDVSTEQITARLAEEFIVNATTHGSEYSRGFVTALVEFLAFYEAVGSPSLDVWRPLEMGLRFNSRGSAPTPGSKLFDYDGIPVSIAPDETVHTWADEAQIERSPEFLRDALKSARPISRKTFNALRAKSRARAMSSAAMAG
jgi:hypothetical protein